MPVDRREFVKALVVTGAAVAAPAQEREQERERESPEPSHPANAASTPIDFRYAPHQSQSTVCFPDDPYKTIVGQAGDLRYGFAKSLFVGMEDFQTIVEFSLAGFADDRVVKQWIEGPGVPVVHTAIERPAATFELIAFATRYQDEGRVDNVLLSVKARKGNVAVAPKVHLRTCEKLDPKNYNSPLAEAVRSGSDKPFFVAAQIGNDHGSWSWWEEAGYTFYLPHGDASAETPARYFFRFPQEGQTREQVVGNLQHPDTLLEATRSFWRTWKPFGSTQWSFPQRHGEFVTACARNIQQAREVKNDRLVFQVGPTVYRGLWIVDGNFLLEAARYLGYDREADEGLRSEWSKQVGSGQVIAAGGGEHWKDTAIAMFTLVRQCELKQDWSLLRELEPNVVKAIDFLAGLRDKAVHGDSTNGRYGLLAPGFADGGIAGVRSEFTNTVWTLAGLRAIADAASQLKIASLSKAGSLYRELYASLQQAARKEMVHDPRGFDYLPMIAHDDPQWQDADPWNRPRPQTAQWALSHAIYPGVVFAKGDPIVRGHIALMQACTREDVPAETGWLWHDALWNYNASFAAHVYLWAGLRDWAHRTFTGFLNHASPLYCWREEQPLQNALVGQDWGDMPHNWASAECVRYLRHMLALEDGPTLRLCEGITTSELGEENKYVLENSPTRFGRIGLELQAEAPRVHLRFKRDAGPTPAALTLPAELGGRRFTNLRGAGSKLVGEHIEIDPAARTWEATFA